MPSAVRGVIRAVAMPRKMGVLFFMVGSSCIRIVLPDLPAAEKGNKKIKQAMRG